MAGRAGRALLLGGIAIWTLAISGATAQQSLAFTEPAANALTALGLTTKYESGQSVQIAWTTPFDFTTLLVFQGPLDDGSYNQDIIAASTSETSTTWTAGVIDGASNASALHFSLQNADDATCDGCSVNSLTFYILEQAVSSTTSSSATSSSTYSASSTMRTTSTTGSAASPTSTSHDLAGAAAGSSATSSATLTANSHNDSQRALDLGLGIGLGLGIPLLLALLGLCAFFALRRRRRRRQSQLPRGQRPQSMARSMAQVSERGSDSPLVQPPVPGAHAQRHSTATTRPRSSYAPSRFSTAGSRASSYFEPFEFERPGIQDFDTRSVVSAMTTASGARGPSRQGLQTLHEDETPTTPQWPLPAHRL